MSSTLTSSALHAIPRSDVTRRVVLRTLLNGRIVYASGDLPNHELTEIVGAHLREIFVWDSWLDVSHARSVFSMCPVCTPPVVDQLDRCWECRILPAHGNEQAIIARQLRRRLYTIVGIKQDSALHTDDHGNPYPSQRFLAETYDPRLAYRTAKAFNDDTYEKRKGYWAIIL